MKNITKALLITGAAVTLAVPFVVNAMAFHGGKGGKFGEMFIERMDANGDGAVTQAEVDAKRTEKFNEFDADKDGQLSATEFQALHDARKRERLEARFQKIDEDGSSTVSAEEFASRSEKMFERFDKNEDGKLTADELSKRGKHYRAD